VALPAVILFGLLAAFFAWQAAEPLWLAVGYGVDGTATVTRCHPTDPPVPAGAGSTESTYRCVTFTPPDRAFQAVDVTLLGAGSAAGRTEGATLPARMVTADADRAYATGQAGLHLRWSVGLALVLACGAGIAWATGARRLDGRRARRRAVLLCFAGPVLLAAGFVTAAL
jgi:hypothetical protein